MFLTVLLGDWSTPDWFLFSPPGGGKWDRTAVGERLEPKGGLQTYFELPSSHLKSINCLSGYRH